MWTVVSRVSEEHLPEPWHCSPPWDRAVPSTRLLSRMVFSVGRVDFLFKNLYISFKAGIQFLLQWHQMKTCFFSLAFIYLAPTPALAWKKEKLPKGEWLTALPVLWELKSLSWEDTFDLLLVSSSPMLPLIFIPLVFPFPLKTGYLSVPLSA